MDSGTGGVGDWKMAADPSWGPKEPQPWVERQGSACLEARGRHQEPPSDSKSLPKSPIGPIASVRKSAGLDRVNRRCRSISADVRTESLGGENTRPPPLGLHRCGRDCTGVHEHRPTGSRRRSPGQSPPREGPVSRPECRGHTHGGHGIARTRPTTPPPAVMAACP